MSTNFFHVAGFFQQRHYFFKDVSPAQIKTAVSQNGKTMTGAGFRSYSKITGFILRLLGYASRINLGDETFLYVNDRSFVKWIIRSVQLTTEEEKDPMKTAKKLHDLYGQYKIRDYLSKGFQKAKNDFHKSVENQPDYEKNITQGILFRVKSPFEAIVNQIRFSAKGIHLT